MSLFTPLRELPKQAEFKKNDVFLLFGELIPRGYANGLVNAAKEAGMTIVGITVGRREKNNALRSLTPEELKEAEANLGGKIYNVPLWGGFDMDSPDDGPTPQEMLKEIKVDNWESFKLDWDRINACRETGIKRFQDSLAKVMRELQADIPKDANVFFAHTMAGGIPKAKILLFLTARIVKGTGDRFLSSEPFWKSDLGRLVKMNFEEVTANTFSYLIQASETIRQKQTQNSCHVCYSAYGYHGSEILINDKYQWQTYTPYLPGWAKVKLEEIARHAWEKNIKAIVYNCPEIRTNSSDLFAGVELSLFPLIQSLETTSDSNWTKTQIEKCVSKLADGISKDKMLDQINGYHCHEAIKAFYENFEDWPRHNNQQLADYMIDMSEQIMNMNKTKKDSISDFLSALVVQSTGNLMLHESWNPHGPVLWLGHDLIAKDLTQRDKG
ncbi:MAG: hypothetical protein OEY59_00590 [Deltaproteobacteria bacterium]|nr:hypothetical protein [Deltaproteobacteria bacterium]